MALLHVTARSHTRVPVWMLDSPGVVQSLGKLPGVAFVCVSVTGEDGKPRTGLTASAFPLLLMATPEPVSSQGVSVALVREEPLDGFYSLVVAPKGKKNWPVGEFVMALQVKVSSKATSHTVVSQGRTVVRVVRD